jgi:hypothetical protein
MSQSQQTLLTAFTQQYLSRQSGILSQCHLVAEVSNRDYNLLVGKNASPRRSPLPTDQYIWGLVLTETGQLVSLLHLTYINDCMLGAEPGQHEIIQWSYSYTLDLPEYRRQGLNTCLRLASILWANQNNYSYMNSVPFTHAHSTPLLVKLGFKRYYDKVFNLDYYIRDIRNRVEVLQLVNGLMK